ncbi:2-hydroxyacid dehydrogenase [Paraburkholderia strydomiana]|uniref:2-hydroxyacid dehydrogenase n=1 Tax=Paraburkholderia strydomiana TaxID=1245417 RepID=UPI00285B14BC|nr:glyoxylate/hydroxypyruvate reductase A [Paraburkholderia strydomiana]MDR7008473.1 glyoxylate/hydroxypyruvate reductase A [Paraburkholderia strydomiana]
MSETIALVSDIHAEQEAGYLSALAAALPNETIVPFRSMSAEQRAHARIAIVANPNPADVAALPNLVWVQSLWAGVEQLVAAWPAAGPQIVRLVDEEMSRTMAEAVLAWTYYLQRDMPAYARQQRDCVWYQRAYRKPSAMTVGVLGLGALGTAAAARVAHAGFKIAGWSRSAKEVPEVATFSGDDGLIDMLRISDIVVCLVPLTVHTRSLLNAERLTAMKPGAALINFSRGPVVVTNHLLAALDSGHLSHAVLDVFDEEPLVPGSRLWRHPQVTVLPHISAPTDFKTAAAVIATNIAAYRATGCLPCGVNIARGY